MKGKLVCLFAIIGLSFSGVLGGVVVEMATKDLASKQEVVDKIYAQGKMLRIEPNQDRTTPRPILLFRGETFFIINPSNKIFYRIDEETVAGMHEQVSKAIEQMKEQLAKLPPEQRAMVEKMIKGGPKGGAGLGMGLDLPPGTSPLSKLDLGPFEVHSMG